MIFPGIAFIYQTENNSRQVMLNAQDTILTNAFRALLAMSASVEEAEIQGLMMCQETKALQSSNPSIVVWMTGYPVIQMYI